MRKPPFANYAIVVGLAVVFFLFGLGLETALRGTVVVGHFHTRASDFVNSVFNWYLISVAVCFVLSLLWLHASEHMLKIDWKGANTQRSWWLIFLFFATLAAPGVGYALVWPAVETGGAFAFGLLFCCVLVQFWVGTLLASPNPFSVVGGRMLRRVGI